jgi:hypothetical protein
VVTRTWLLAFGCVAIAIAVLGARPLQTPGPLARDFEAYWAAGDAWNLHADPYGRAVWNAERTIAGVDAKRDELLPFVGPPATLLLWSVAARMPYAVATRLWWAVLGLSTLALAAAAMRGSGKPIGPFSFAAAVVLAIAFAPITSDWALGQLALPAFVGAVLLTVLAERSMPLASAGACLAFTQPNAAIGLVSQIGRNRATMAIVIGGSIAYALGVLDAGWGWPLNYSRVVLAHGDAERFIAIQLSPAAIAFGFGATPREAAIVALVLAMLAVAAALALAFAVREPFARFAGFSALAPFVAGFFHEHDLVVAYAAALWCALRTRGMVRTIALTGTLLVGCDWLGLAQRPTGVAQSLFLTIAAFTAFVALDESANVRAAMPIALAVAALFVGAALLATHHPVPVWPDTLGAFHAPQKATAAAVWLAEQRASGLLAAVPAWAMLRSLSLLGCGLLAYAIYRHSAYCRTA